MQSRPIDSKKEEETKLLRLPKLLDRNKTRASGQLRIVVDDGQETEGHQNDQKEKQEYDQKEDKKKKEQQQQGGSVATKPSALEFLCGHGALRFPIIEE